MDRFAGDPWKLYKIRMDRVFPLIRRYLTKKKLNEKNLYYTCRESCLQRNRILRSSRKKKKVDFFSFVLGLERFVDEKHESLSPFQLFINVMRTHTRFTAIMLDRFSKYSFKYYCTNKSCSCPEQPSNTSIFSPEEEESLEIMWMRISFYKSGDSNRV